MSRQDSDEFFYEVTSRIPGAAKGKQAVPKVAGFLKKPYRKAQMAAAIAAVLHS